MNIHVSLSLEVPFIILNNDKQYFSSYDYFSLTYNLLFYALQQ